MKSELLQLYLFRQSLLEINVEGSINIDHRMGFNYINNTQFDIKYPKEYIDRIDNIPKEKHYEYCFIGFIGKLGRADLLKKFKSDKSIIKNSLAGRNVDTKYNFDSSYYDILSKSKFSLCPNHVGDWYTHDRAWTYRYIESLFCKTIPIVFRETQLGKDFLKDTFFFWDDDDHTLSKSEYNSIVKDNYQKSLKYWSFINGEL